jgi:hypothetical protein
MSVVHFATPGVHFSSRCLTGQVGCDILLNVGAGGDGVSFLFLAPTFVVGKTGLVLVAVQGDPDQPITPSAPAHENPVRHVAKPLIYLN